MLLYTVFIVFITIMFLTGLLLFIVAYAGGSPLEKMKYPWLQIFAYLVWPLSLVFIYVRIWMVNNVCWEHEWKETSREGYWIQKTCNKCGDIVSENLDYKERNREW